MADEAQVPSQPAEDLVGADGVERGDALVEDDGDVDDLTLLVMPATFGFH